MIEKIIKIIQVTSFDLNVSNANAKFSKDSERITKHTIRLLKAL